MYYEVVLAIYLMGVFIAAAALGRWRLDAMPGQLVTICLAWPIFVVYYIFVFTNSDYDN